MAPRKRTLLPDAALLLPLDITAPMASLRVLSGEGVCSMARLRGRPPSNQVSQEKAGERIQLTTLTQAAAAVGYRLHLYAEKL